MALSKSIKTSTSDRKYFDPRWEEDYLCLNLGTHMICLVCKQILQIKKYNLQKHYTNKHSADYKDIIGEERKALLEERKLLVAKEPASELSSYTPRVFRIPSSAELLVDNTADEELDCNIVQEGETRHQWPSSHKSTLELLQEQKARQELKFAEEEREEGRIAHQMEMEMCLEKREAFRQHIKLAEEEMKIILQINLEKLKQEQIKTELLLLEKQNKTL